MAKKYKFGILGLMRGRAPLNSLSQMTEFVEVTGVVEQNPETIEDVRKNGWLKDDVKVYDTYEELLDSGIDAVVLADYFHMHCKHAIMALDKGIAVFSETTAAPSLGECVDLVEAVERNNGKYMLLANCPYFMALQLAKRKMQDKEYGDLIYAEAEYVHPVDPATQRMYDPENLHWRETLPQNYYNMHSLGPLMYMTESMPKKVIGKAAVYQHKRRATNTPKAFILTEMDNGAVFNTTGCVGVGSLGKWYRLAFERGTMETKRLVEEPNELICADLESKNVETIEPTWDTCGALTKEEYEKYKEVIATGGHGGCDAVLFIDIIKYLNGEATPFFDVYRSVALSAVGILGWYSILDNSKELLIPDFKNPEDREKVRGDYRKPFGKTMKDLTLPCRLD